MAQPLQVLIVDDSPEDAELLANALKKSGFEPVWQRVETEGAFVAHLTPPPQVILCDYHMPEFDPFRAMDLLKALDLDIPFIVVTGALGDEKAVEVMKRGANDYLLKDRLGRLGKAVEQALEQRRLKQRDARASKVLDLSEERYKSLFENAREGIYVATFQGSFLAANPALAKLLQYDSPNDLLLTIIDLHQQIYADPSVGSEFLRLLEKNGKVESFEAPLFSKDKQTLWVLQSAKSVLDDHGKILYYECFVEDITAKRNLDEQLKQRSKEVDSLLEALGQPKKYGT